MTQSQLDLLNLWVYSTGSSDGCGNQVSNNFSFEDYARRTVIKLFCSRHVFVNYEIGIGDVDVFTYESTYAVSGAVKALGRSNKLLHATSRSRSHGVQYVSLLPGKTMKKAGIRPSMGSVSSPWDNAVTESLMGVIKSECVHARIYDSREQAALSLFEYIEAFYSRLRIRSPLGWLSPTEFEERHANEGRSKAA